MSNIDINNPFLANPLAVKNLIEQQAGQMHRVSKNSDSRVLVKTKGYSSQKSGKGAKRHG